MEMRTHISIITLNVNGLNAPIKKEIEWLNGYKNKTRMACKTVTPDLKTHKLKGRGWKKVFYAKGNQKKDRLDILISDKIVFKKGLLQETKKDTT